MNTVNDYNIECTSGCQITESVYLDNKPILAYMAFPYARPSPKQNMEKARKIAKAIMKKYPNIFIILPHTAVDMTLFGYVPEVVEDHPLEDHLIAGQLEFTILSKVDLFILGCELDFAVSQGMCWETAFVRWLQSQGKNIQIVHAEELLK